MKSNHKLLIAVIAGSTAIVGAAIILCVFYIYYYRRKSHRQNVYRLSCLDSDKMSGSCRALMMDFKKIESATDNFRETNILGAGGFGCVYQGHLQPANISIAVKKLSNADAITQFQTEVELLSKIEHPNIITLLGYCIHGETRLLVYQLMHNGSLETQLHGPSKGSALTWHLRLKIALDVARGLEYLHKHCRPRIIHRDLKSSNILLDSNFNAKLSDFGLAILDGSQKKSQLKLSGTLGYVAPEYLLDGKLTDKSDVYGFGVVLLELLLGRKPMEKPAPPHTQSTVSWAMPQLTDRTKLPNIVDPVIANSMDMKHLYQVAAVALLCIQPEPSYRPLIADILLSLVPLVPVELGGTLRDEKSLKPATYVHT
ncbi:probable receptor-like protein kinase At1g80640 [Salvia splendens]|uniref:probable receptor-like protein kinase At1g80640 n=1 Tax=Salvia splendens TaxID=180675 RepID=UPI001C277CEB|nr:probable receptor-like protein kinase At1g80640 [Salvia splendens]